MKRPANIEMYVVLADLHHPEHCTKAFNAVLSFIDKNRAKIKGVVLLGDNMNCENFSRHTKGKPRLRTRGGITNDFANFNRDILKKIEANINKGTKKLFFLGNHEDWLEQWLDENPEFEGTVSFDKILELSKRGWEVVPQGGYRRVGKAYLIHGDQVGSSMHVAKKMVDSFCATTIMGHVHYYSTYTKVSQIKAKDKWLGVTLPCLSTLSPKYAKGRPNAFIHGLGIIEKWPNDFVNIYVPIIFEGSFSFGGEMYSGV